VPSMRRVFAVPAILVAVYVAFHTLGSEVAPKVWGPPTATTTAPVITPAEDDLAFDCQVHGNRRCGP
jgi:hypothetical protein